MFLKIYLAENKWEIIKFLSIKYMQTILVCERPKRMVGGKNTERNKKRVKKNRTDVLLSYNSL